jgi:transglutaminase-like putative cysteine protease
MSLYRIAHNTSYHYKRPVKFDTHRLMFRPRDSFDQKLIFSSLRVQPAGGSIRWSHDVFGNCVAEVSFSESAKLLRFETNLLVDHSPDAAPDFTIDRKALTYPVQYSPEEEPDLASTIVPQFPEDACEVHNWARQFVGSTEHPKTASLLMTMCFAIHEAFTYQRRAEHGTQRPLLTLQTKRGSCRDFAVLMMEAVRSLGFAARFVTGYLYVPDRDIATRLGGGSTHAWCQVYLPGAGWVEFDPTNGIVGNRDLIRVAVARNPRQAVPLSGSYRGARTDFVSMEVQVNVTHEPPGIQANDQGRLSSVTTENFRR